MIFGKGFSHSTGRRKIIKNMQIKSWKWPVQIYKLSWLSFLFLSILMNKHFIHLPIDLLPYDTCFLNLLNCFLHTGYRTHHNECFIISFLIYSRYWVLLAYYHTILCIILLSTISSPAFNPFHPDCRATFPRIFYIFICYFYIFKTWTWLLCQIHICST